MVVVATMNFRSKAHVPTGFATAHAHALRLANISVTHPVDFAAKYLDVYSVHFRIFSWVIWQV